MIAHVELMKNDMHHLFKEQLTGDCAIYGPMQVVDGLLVAVVVAGARQRTRRQVVESTTTVAQTQQRRSPKSIFFQFRESVTINIIVVHSVKVCKKVVDTKRNIRIGAHFISAIAAVVRVRVIVGLGRTSVRSASGRQSRSQLDQTTVDGRRRRQRRR